MLRHKLIIIFILIPFTVSCFSQTAENDSKLREIISQYDQAEVTIPYTNKKSADIISQNVSVVNVRDNLIYIKLSRLTVDWFILQKFKYVIVEKLENKSVISTLNISEAWDWETYPTYTQYDSIMQIFCSNYPDLCILDTIGTSVNGRLVLALKISDNAVVNEDEPEVFYSSTIHGDETGGYYLMLRLIDYLLKNYSLNARVKNLVDNLEIWINPLANPDGTYNYSDIITYDSPTRFNANGVDLNRNFPDPFTPNTVKEKETLDMIKFLRDHRFALSANFHSGVEVVNYPWDRWLFKFHADDDWFYNISRAYADTVHVYSGPAYMNYLDNGVTRGAAWYIVYGGRQDFVTSELQGREVTIELDDSYVTPPAQLELLWQNNWHSLLGYLENAMFGIHGLVVDSITNEPVPAKIFIDGHDKDSSQVYSDSLTGSFVRLLEPGFWNLTFSAKGYYNTTLTDLEVVSGQKSDVLVKLTPFENGIDAIIPELPILYPIPAKTKLNAILSERFTGIVRVNIITMSGILISDFYKESVHGIPVLIDLTKLAGGIYTVIFINPETKLSTSSRFIVIK